MPGTRFWRSERTGIRYPVAWRLGATEPNLSLGVEAVFEEQEFHSNLWEGSCEVTGEVDGTRVQGRAFVEVFRGAQGPPHKKALSYARAAAGQIWSEISGRKRRGNHTWLTN